MIRIWGRKNSLNVQKVMWTVAELGLAHERLDVGGPFGGLDAAYREKNPNGLIPVIEDRGTVIWESNAIVRYLAARWGQGLLWDSDPARRALADQWMDWQQTIVQPSLSPLFLGLIRTPEAQRDQVALQAAAARLHEVLALLDAHLRERTFIAGDELTMADIPLGAAVNRYLHLPIERPALPSLQAWHERLVARACFRSHVMIPLS
ncbi:glutathione S-transferase family protein [Geminicoccus flavidas]|uniref:glutathione S-transferase family protein n=1 Tax=Geminicoccus flavidas TaxID=2506407 RepID=UPI001358AD3A|nr:glutathione S-transferase [Geminicoccus flavidas]